MTKSQMNKLRSSTLNENEILKVRHIGGEIQVATPKFVKGSGLPYPQPKWEPCCYYVEDIDGDSFEVARERYGKIHPDFEWVK